MLNSSVTIVFPKRDQAAMSMWRYLKERSAFFPIENEIEIYAHHSFPEQIQAILIDNDGVNINNVEKMVKTDLFIYASRHSAQSGFPALLVHTPGNWSEAALGGNSYELAYSSALAIKLGLKSLKKQQQRLSLIDYRVGIEVTHHGPTNMMTPLCFMELGSNEKYWKDPKGAEAVAKSILEVAKEYINFSFNKTRTDYDVYVGFGGNHYAYRFEKFIENEPKALIGHIAPKYVLDDLSFEMVMQAFEKTIEKPKGAIIDKKGTRSEHRQKIKDFMKKLDREYLEL